MAYDITSDDRIGAEPRYSEARQHLQRLGVSRGAAVGLVSQAREVARLQDGDDAKRSAWRDLTREMHRPAAGLTGSRLTEAAEETVRLVREAGVE